MKNTFNFFLTLTLCLLTFSCVSSVPVEPDTNTGACEPGDCGPALGAPAYLCADGSTGGNTGVCKRNREGVCGWEIRDCPAEDPNEALVYCGTRGLPFECGEGKFCKREPIANCGRADHPGVCTPLPEACIQVVQPVCGCDGTTYGNDCMAHAAGISVDYLGECGVRPDPTAGE